MRYADKSFAVTVGGKDYAEGWERTFGKKVISGSTDGGATVEVITAESGGEPVPQDASDEA